MSTTIKYPKIAPDFSEAPKGAWSQNSIKDYLYPLSFIWTCYIFQTTIEMENVVDCQLMEEKSNGKSLFRVIYFSHNARDFKHYDFEAESDMSGKCCGAFLGRSFMKHCIGIPLSVLYLRPVNG